MCYQARIKKLAITLAPALILAFSSNTFAADEGAEFKALLKKNDCFKCHAFDKTKKGPSYKSIAAKYKGKEDEGEAKLIKNITSGQKVKLEDGTEEEHKIIDTKDPKVLKDLARWILAQ